MAPKAKAAAEEPPAKKAKTGEGEVAADTKFQEPDAKPITGQAIKDAICMDNSETTLNVVPTSGGKVFSCLTEGGMSYLMGGARASVGMKAGRYMFEVEIVHTNVQSE